jgi:uncharacterized protein (TIGR03000 family)
MYSLVLMMALGTSADTPAFGRNGCNGCSGWCNGGGYACNGCSGWGCNGGGCSGGRKGLFGGGGLFGGKRRGGCNGCNGGYGCWNGCNGGGCHGGYACHGGYGCNGGMMCHGGYGCHGGMACNGGHGCHTSNGCHQTQPKPENGDKEVTPKPENGTKPNGTSPKPDGTSSLAPATIVVTLPSDAKLTVDDSPTTSTSGVRVFASPALPRGKEFSYTLKAEITRDGQTVSDTKRVIVRAGEEARVTFTLPAETVAAR